jgi:hypothetical protein
MAEYILILVIYSGGPAITSILFPSKAACEIAMKATAGLVNNTSRAYSICVPRGTP